MSSGKILRPLEVGHLTFPVPVVSIADRASATVDETAHVNGPIAHVAVADQSVTPSGQFDLTIENAPAGTLIVVTNGEATQLDLQPFAPSITGAAAAVAASKSALLVMGADGNLLKLAQQA